MASTPPTATKQAAIIANPAKVDIAALRRAVTAAEQEFGWPESICLETTEDDPGVGQTAEALDRGASLIVAAGGDGTVRVVAEALQGSSARLGLIPAGTGNLLARNLGIDVNSVTHALAIAFGDSERKIDLGIADVERPDGSREHTVFTVLCGVGIDAAMIANTDDDLKRRVGWVAYVDGIRRSLKGGSTMRFRCRTDQGPTISVHANTIMVGNCGLLPGNVVLMPSSTTGSLTSQFFALTASEAGCRSGRALSRSLASSSAPRWASAGLWMAAGCARSTTREPASSSFGSTRSLPSLRSTVMPSARCVPRASTLKLAV